jgi:hypothetical protein
MCTYDHVSLSSHNEKCFRQICRENQRHFSYSITPFFGHFALYDIMLKNTVEPDRSQMTTLLTCIACWITKATNTLSEYVIPISFPPQQWLHKIASILPYTTHCLFFLIIYTFYIFPFMKPQVSALYLYEPDLKPCSEPYRHSTSKPTVFNTLSPELNPICYLLALLARDFLHVTRIRVKSLTLRLLMSYIYIYGAPIIDVSRSHTTTHHSR